MSIYAYGATLELIIAYLKSEVFPKHFKLFRPLTEGRIAIIPVKSKILEIVSKQILIIEIRHSLLSHQY